ncbi:hypothetical protein NHG29_01695 [Aerococcaceae bacterium NML160702]|nr:hypothetical protein [Aerococcaceae bacterium NML160702]
MNNLDKANRSIWNLSHLAHGFEALGFETTLDGDTLWVSRGGILLATIDWRDGLILSDVLPDGMYKGQIRHLFSRFLQGRFGSEYGRRFGLSA